MHTIKVVEIDQIKIYKQEEKHGKIKQYSKRRH